MRNSTDEINTELLEACKYALEWLKAISKENVDLVLDNNPRTDTGTKLISGAISKAEGKN